MGGEGAMMAANNSLKTNRALVSKRKDCKALSGSYAGVEMAAFPKATEKELELLRHKLKEESKRTRIKLTVVFIVIVVFLVTLSILLF